MLLPGTYANGFAPRDGSPLYPSLWKGCVGAWNPGLGVSGLTLRDQSGFQNNGVLTQSYETFWPTWAASQGRYALSFDGTKNFVSLAANYNSLDASNAWTISVWFKSNGWYEFGGIVQCGNFGIVQTRSSKFGLLRTTDNVSVRQVSAATVTTGVWVHLVAVVSGPDSASPDPNSNLYHNGTLNNGTWVDDKGYGVGTKIGSQYNPTRGEIDDVRIYNRALSPQEIRTLATRRGIAYEMAPRRRSSSAVAVTTSYSTFRPSVLRGSR